MQGWEAYAIHFITKYDNEKHKCSPNVALLIVFIYLFFVSST